MVNYEQNLHSALLYGAGYGFGTHSFFEGAMTALVFFGISCALDKLVGLVRAVK